MTPRVVVKMLVAVCTVTLACSYLLARYGGEPSSVWLWQGFLGGKHDTGEGRDTGRP